jgi:transcriptional regulator with XRE-family HTH domain
MSSQISSNVRYLLWRAGVPREQWEAWLSARTELGGSKCKMLVAGRLLDEQITSEALRDLARAFEQADDGESLRFSDFFGEGTNVLAENLRFLFASLGRGSKKQIAAELEVDPTTVSRWLSGAFEPQGALLRQLVTYFGLPQDTDLRRTPIFLSVEPVAAAQRRQWLHTQIDALSAEDFRELYPALRRMLKEP